MEPTLDDILADLSARSRRTDHAYRLAPSRVLSSPFNLRYVRRRKVAQCVRTCLAGLRIHTTHASGPGVP
jgi:hypothetical protein